ncbi:hypothetical protein X777_05885 [Ooceraea biroi]|uniref:Ribosome biogenesis protein NOP53 n=1 Tax=Ooceraea biroi TaxID=2015173 RepID=A0A026WEE6_OOCBI|nr:hypothetical protein X777_05885 [Ooceraea biroi]
MVDIINTAKTKKHKVSKKTKKSWRKHVDINDVDAFLDNKRLEERLGAPFSERPDSELFTIDKNASATKPVKSAKREARLALKSKEPRCFASLKPHTKVPDPISKRNRVRTKEERMSSVLRQREAERKMKGILKLKEKVVLKNRALAKAAAAKRPKRGEITGDAWQVTKNDLLPEKVTDWMSSDSLRHTIKHLGVNKRKVPSSLGKKPSILPAVEAPHPGTSYNPSYTDHQELLHEIAQKELELIKQEKHLDRVTTQMFKKIPLNKRDEYMMKEMSEGLPNINKTTVNSKSAQEDQEEEEEDSSVVGNDKTVKNIKKTLVQRRKQREQKQEANERALMKCEKKKLSDVYKLNILQKQIEAKEKKEELLRQKRMKKCERESTMPRTLGRIKFEPMDSDFQLMEELTGNLRNCKPSMNLLKDRYKSLQQRNIVAPTKREKAKMKKFVKPDHKIDLDIVKRQGKKNRMSKTRKT